MCLRVRQLTKKILSTGCEGGSLGTLLLLLWFRSWKRVAVQHRLFNLLDTHNEKKPMGGKLIDY